MTFLDWIQRVEKLHPNFEEWQGDETGRLLQKLAAKLNTEVPSEEVINGMEEFPKLQIDDIVQAIEDVWFQLSFTSLSFDEHDAIEQRESFVVKKHVFNIKVYREMLNHKQRFVLQKEINESVSRIVLHICCLRGTSGTEIEKQRIFGEYHYRLPSESPVLTIRIAHCTWGTMVDMGGIDSFMVEYKISISPPVTRPLRSRPKRKSILALGNQHQMICPHREISVATSVSPRNRT